MKVADIMKINPTTEIVLRRFNKDYGFLLDPTKNENLILGYEVYNLTVLVTYGNKYLVIEVEENLDFLENLGYEMIY